ncbi:MAG: hypothetical protein ACYDCL_16225 [Myxococcales bacterium]
MTYRRLLLFLCLAAGCPSGAPPPPPVCSANSDCPPGQPICLRIEANGGQNACGCNTNLDCHGAPCKQNSCQACQTDADCDPGLLCEDGGCGGCQGDAGCPAGTVCHLGICGVSCDVELDAGTVSRDLTALGDVGATGDAGVAGGFAAFGWTTSGEQLGCQGQLPGLFYLCIPCDGCAAGQSCVAGDCTCATSGDCAASNLVCVNGFCGACAADSDCGCGRVCTLGRCHPACGADADCQVLDAGMNRCDPSGHCAPCLSDADCSGGAKCYEDGCVIPYAGCAYGTANDAGRCPPCEVYAPGPWPASGSGAACVDGGAPDGGDAG